MIQANFLRFPEKYTIRFYVLYEERYIALNTPTLFRKKPLTPIIDYTLLSNLASHGCQIVHWEPLNAEQSCPKKTLVFAMSKCLISTAPSI